MISVDRSADDLVVHILFHRDRLSRDHGFIDRRVTFRYDAIYRHFISGANTQDIAGFNIMDRYFFIFSVLHQNGFSRAQLDELLNRRIRFGMRLCFHDLTKKNQGQNNYHRFKVQMHFAMVSL